MIASLPARHSSRERPRASLPSMAIIPRCRTGRSLLGNAIARDGWRVVQSDDCHVGIGIARSRHVGTIALPECIRGARPGRIADFGRTQQRDAGAAKRLRAVASELRGHRAWRCRPARTWASTDGCLVHCFVSRRSDADAQRPGRCLLVSTARVAGACSHVALAMRALVLEPRGSGVGDRGSVGLLVAVCLRGSDEVRWQAVTLCRVG